MNRSESPITDQEFALFQRLIYKLAGISLSDAKRVLLVGRLGRRLKHYRFDTYSQYYRLLSSGEHPEELQQMVDLLTTNETYFFREPQHFDFLRDVLLGGAGRHFPHLERRQFERRRGLLDGDGARRASQRRTLGGIRVGHQPDRPGAEHRPGSIRRSGFPAFRQTTAQVLPEGRPLAGRQAADRQPLKQRVRFAQVNLTQPITGVGDFDVIFLRNVMIYFDAETKRKVIENMLPQPEAGRLFHRRPFGIAARHQHPAAGPEADHLSPVDASIRSRFCV
jgi:chemotaxis protein methyltransferase CheR